MPRYETDWDAVPEDTTVCPGPLKDCPYCQPVIDELVIEPEDLEPEE